jgi:hypothetical protein
LHGTGQRVNALEHHSFIGHLFSPDPCILAPESDFAVATTS